MDDLRILEFNSFANNVHSRQYNLTTSKFQTYCNFCGRICQAIQNYTAEMTWPTESESFSNCSEYNFSINE